MKIIFQIIFYVSLSIDMLCKDGYNEKIPSTRKANVKPINIHIFKY